ncbi:hypothetical protein FHS36_003786 [Streptomyces eurocidicus]|uniref:Uncharacterized protein n=1 Tax=Streptomyces eurocidicus TaxID=66423 RepID=A0A7W8BF66_STREU|nr:hypothetical protein [Streptomyces eurocidicus]
MMGNPPYGQWLADHPGIAPGTFTEAATAADGIVVNGHRQRRRRPGRRSPRG